MVCVSICLPVLRRSLTIHRAADESGMCCYGEPDAVGDIDNWAMKDFRLLNYLATIAGTH